MENQTLNKLLSEKGIVIPIIQRDYVQGSNNQEERRNEFIKTLIKTLSETDKIQNLDFIYGRTFEGDGFLPLDGQQRLTTLFILTYYLFHKAGRYSEVKKLLSNFSYKTRISTNRFISMLVNLSQDATDYWDYNENNRLSERIKNEVQYDSTWDNDPSIISMLNLLDYLNYYLTEDTLNKEGIKLDFSNACNRLQNGAICFDELDMDKDDFKLTDSLYIKMNSRGKQLTEFENFKAQFINFLETEYKQEKLSENSEKNIKDDFCEKIEHQWTALFWPYAFEEWEKKSDEEKEKSKYPIIDDYFLNCFYVICQLIFFKDNIKASADTFNTKFDFIKSLFDRSNAFGKENLRICFSFFDFFYSISEESVGLCNKELIDKYFSEIFYNDGNYQSNKIRLFIDSEEINLFHKLLEEGLNLDVKPKILIFSLVYYQISNPKDSNPNKFIRVIRNLLEARRQFNETKINSNVRVNEFGAYWKLFKQFISTEYSISELLIMNHFDNNESMLSNSSLEHEVNKAKINNQDILCRLEDCLSLKGNLTNLNILENESKLEEIYTMINSVFENDIDERRVIQSLIAVGFSGFYIKWCAMGGTWYFGGKRNWEFILTYPINTEENFIQSFINLYLKAKGETPNIKLKNIIDEYKTNFSQNTWKYYFLTYDIFISDSLDLANYFAWDNDKNNFEIRKIKDSTRPINAKHCNPYVLTVCKELNNNSLCSITDCLCVGTYNSPLILRNGVELICTEKGWKIHDKDNVVLGELKKKYNIKKDNILEMTEKLDMIQIAIKFCKEFAIN